MCLLMSHLGLLYSLHGCVFLSEIQLQYIRILLISVYTDDRIESERLTGYLFHNGIVFIVNFYFAVEVLV